MTLNNKTKLGLITAPLARANVQPFLNLVEIFNSIEKNPIIIYILDDTIQFDLPQSENIIKILHKKENSNSLRILNLGITQLALSTSLLQNIKRANIFFFFLSDTNLLPIIIAKIFQRKIVLIMGGNVSYEIRNSHDTIQKPLLLFRYLTLKLSDNIIIYTNNLISSWNLEYLSKKILVAHRHYINPDDFSIQIPFRNRKNIIGYIGRFSEEKGIENFLKSILYLPRSDYDYWICGSGHLKANIEFFIKTHCLENRVFVIEWVAHDEIAQYLNAMKLLVIPSYSEGLPNIMLEALACGTLVLANPVGSIPDVIIDGQSGFLMENNSPECIAQNIERVITFSDLDSVIVKGRNLIENSFSFFEVRQRWKKMIQKIV